jgi:hypothetical protein
LSGKFVDLAKELNKSQSSVSYLWHTDWADGQHRYALTREAAEKVGLEIRVSPITNIGQLNDLLVTIKQRGSTAFIVQPSPFTYAERGQIIAAAIKYGLGTIFAFPVAAKEGSLVMAPITCTSIVALHSMSIVSSRAASRPSFPSNNLQRSNYSLICRLPRL